MATITTSQDWDSAARTAGEAIIINSAATLTINTDTRYHKNAPASGTGSLGSITMTDVRGGTLLIDGRDVRLLPFTSGTGNVPAYDTDIVGDTSTATGKLLGVYTAINAAPTAVGAAMPASGFIKLKSASTSYNASETLTGIGASTNGVDVAGWIEVVARDLSNINIARAQQFQVRSEWFYLDNTSGSRNQVIQLPTCGGGANTYYAGVWIESSPGSNTYEFWAAQRYTAALSSGWFSTAKGTDERSKFVEMQAGGAIRIGTNAAGDYGHLPVSGCKVRIPNVLMMACTSGSDASNTVPHATVTSRPEFAISSAGNVDIDGAMINWYMNLNQGNTVSVKNSAIMDNIVITECATQIVFYDSGTGNYLNTDVHNLTLTSNLAGGDFQRCKFGRTGVRSSSDYGIYINYSKDITFTDCFFEGRIFRTHGASFLCYSLYCDNIRFIRPIMVGGGISCAGCTNSYVEDPIYADSYHTTSSATSPPSGVIVFTSGSTNSILKGGDWWHGIANVHIDSAFLSLAGATNTRWYSCGTPSVPIVGGSSNRILYACNDAGNNIGVKLQRIYFDDVGTRFYTSLNSSKGVLLENCASAYADTNTVFDCLDGLMKGQKVAAMDTAFTSVYGTIFYNIFTSATVGRVGLCFNEETTTYASYVDKTGLTGASGFSSTGLLYLYNLDDEIIYEFPYYVKGYTGFAASNVVKGGSNTGNIDVDYQIDINDGNGFSAWKDAISANLAAETIDEVDGFKLKIRCKCTTTATNYLNSLYFSMVTDATAQEELYPLNVVNVTLTGLTANSRIQLYDLSNDVELFNGIETTTTLTFATEYLSNFNVRVRIMYQNGTTANVFQEFTETVTSNGLTRSIVPTVDSIYNSNAIDGSAITDITIIDGTLLVEVDTGTISLQQIYAYETYWLYTEEGIRDESRFITAVDRANYIFEDFKIKNVQTSPATLVIAGGYIKDSITGEAIDVIDTSGGTIFLAPEHVVPFATGGGGGATAADVWSYGTRTLSSGGVTAIQSGLATQASVDTIDSIVDAILVDTGTTLQAQIDTLPTLAEVEGSTVLALKSHVNTVNEGVKNSSLLIPHTTNL